ncbi:uncharacterized protein LOC100175179 [Ciona intestinalis]
MFSEAKEKNKVLRDKLKKLRLESYYSCEGTECFMTKPKMDSTYGAPRASSSVRYHDRDTTDVSRNSSMLSDRAKVVRSEASRRIDSLLTDWREYRERAEEEIRRRSKMEQYLREMVTRRERETEEISFELTTMRSQLIEQKRAMDEMSEERETEAKCRAKCVELERQITKLNHYISQLLGEIQSRDDVIKAGAVERGNLQQLNSDLRHRNLEQQNKIEMCEHDVTETRMELEILEDMVKALNERKTSIIGGSISSPPQTPRPQSNPRAHSTAAYPNKTNPILTNFSFDTTVLEGSPQVVKEATKLDAERLVKHSSFSSDAAEQPRVIGDKKSALSALKSMQKEHSQKCSYLADHIKKLKDENKQKEKKICELQGKHKKTGPME